MAILRRKMDLCYFKSFGCADEKLYWGRTWQLYTQKRRKSYGCKDV